MTDYNLPELPEPCEAWLPKHTLEYYTADQLRAYAIAAIQQQAGHGEAVAWISKPAIETFRACSAVGAKVGAAVVNIQNDATPVPLYTAPPRVKVTKRQLTDAAHRLVDETDAGQLLSLAMLAALQSLGFGVEVSHD